MRTRARRGVSEQKAILAVILITLVGGVLFYGGFQNYFAGSGEVALLSAELYKSTDGTCTFTCAVKNTGAKPAKEVTVKLAEEQPAAVPGVSEVSPLEPGQSATLVLSTGSGLVNDYVAGETYIVSVHAVFLDGSAFAKTSSVVCRGGGKPLPQAFEFAVGVEPEGGSAPQGGSVEATVTVSLISGTPSTVSLSAAGLPQGASASFTPSHGTPPFESTMRISVGPLAPVGTCAVEIRARCGAVTETAEFQLTVTEGAFNFAVSVQPSSGATVQGGSVEATVTVSLVSGTPSTVSLSAAGLPQGASASFTPSHGTPPFESTMRISVGPLAPVGTCAVEIRARCGAVTETAEFQLTVTEGAFNFAVSVQPSSGATVQGGSVEATVTVSLVSGTPSTVSLSAAGLPQGASASFTPSHGTPPFESTMRISVGPLAPVGTCAVEIRARCGAVTETAEFQLTVTEGAFNFAVSVQPSSGATVQGGSVEATVTVSLVSGTPSTVSLSAAGLPQGASASFTPSHGTPPFESTMRISVGPLAPVGTCAVEIRARCGAVTETAEFQLTVTEGAFNFAVSVQPSSGATVQGGSVEATVTVSLVSGLPHAVELSAQNLPEGASASFNPQSGNPTFQSALTVSTSETTPPGTYDILIVGVGGGVERSAMFTLTVAESVAEVVFSAEGVGSDNDGMVLYVDGEVYANLPQAFSWQVGSEHSFEWVSPVGTQTWGKRYVWTSTRGLSTGRSGSIFVPSGGGSIIAAYKTQYYLTMQVDPADGGSVSPESGWFDADGTVEVSAFPAEGYVFSGWMGEGEGSYSGADNPATVTMNGPVRETACFVQMLPWLSGWSLRKSHEIVGSTAGAQTDYQVRITAYYGIGIDSGESMYLNGKCRADFGDVRFTASDGLTLLDYWMESCIASSSAVFWVKVPYIPASPDTATIYIYYGNPLATTTSNQILVGIAQLKEHKYSASYPDIRFLKPTDTELRIDSYQAGASSIGHGYAFFVVPRAWINGKYLRWRWSGGRFDTTDPRVHARMLIYDGVYNRKSTSDFPSGSSIPTKGNGLLQQYDGPNTYGTWGPTTVDLLVNVAGGSLDYVTIFFRMNDDWTANRIYLDLDFIEINTGPGGSGNIVTLHFTESVVMEVTKTYLDYGLFRKYVSSEPSHGAWGSEEILP